MKVIKEKHPLVMRWTHWINFPILIIMIWSGMLIYWANDVYSLTIFGHTFVQFFPEWFYKLLHIPYRLSEGMAFHFLFMWFFALNGILYVIYTIISGAWRELVPKRNDFKEAWMVILHDLHIRKTVPPKNKYNSAQRIAYTAILIMGFGSIITGLAIYKPVQFYWLCWLCGGYHFARILHFTLTLGYVFFFLIHVVQVTFAGWNNFRSAISGFEIQNEKPENEKSGNEKLEYEKPENGNLQSKKPKKELTTDQKINRRNFISFTTFLTAGAAAFSGWNWLYHSPEETAGITGGAHRPLRRALNKTELFFRNFYSNKHLVKTYPKAIAAANVRINSNIGIDDQDFKPENWHLSVKKNNGQVLKITIQDIMALPKTELVFDFKCVEGWDQIQHWAGVKLIDFIEHFGLEDQISLPYIGMETPNGAYYVGLETESALHPQTILAYEMNDKPLTLDHGAPLRLIIPVKYGIKNLKRIGTISFSKQRPRDYWAEQGYDYYSGL